MKNLLTKKKIGSKLTVLMLLSLSFTNYVVSAAAASGARHSRQRREESERIANERRLSENRIYVISQEKLRLEQKSYLKKSYIDEELYLKEKLYLQKKLYNDLKQSIIANDLVALNKIFKKNPRINIDHKYPSETMGKNIQDKSYAPLDYAVYYNNLEMVKELVKKGANLDSACNNKDLFNDVHNRAEIYTYLDSIKAQIDIQKAQQNALANLIDYGCLIVGNYEIINADKPSLHNNDLNQLIANIRNHDKADFIVNFESFMNRYQDLNIDSNFRTEIKDPQYDINIICTDGEIEKTPGQIENTPPLTSNQTSQKINLNLLDYAVYFNSAEIVEELLNRGANIDSACENKKFFNNHDHQAVYKILDTAKAKKVAALKAEQAYDLELKAKKVAALKAKQTYDLASKDKSNAKESYDNAISKHNAAINDDSSFTYFFNTKQTNIDQAEKEKKIAALKYAAAVKAQAAAKQASQNKITLDLNQYQATVN